MAKLIYYKCNVIGGFRLSDLNRQVSQDEVIELEEHVANTSKAVIAAKKAGWLIEAKKPRASSKKTEDTDTKKENLPKNPNKSLGTSVPDAKRVNKSLETRQAEEIASKISQPDFKEVAKPKAAEPSSGVSIPDIQEVQKNASLRQKDNLTNKDEVIKTVVVKQVDTIEKLANEEEMDDGLSVPDFDEKEQDDGKPDENSEQTDAEEEAAEAEVEIDKTESNEEKVEESSKDEEPKQTIRRKKTVV